MSIVHNGKVLDYRFEKREIDTVFWLGDKRLGTLYNLGSKMGWTAILIEPIAGWPIHVNGFISRRRAAEYLLRAHGYIKN